MPVVVGMRLTRRTLRLASLRTLANRILQSIGEREALLSLEIVGDVRMRRLNRTFRHRDKTTDVLAFATREGPGPPSALLGDVVISLPQAIRQARRHSRGIDHELVVLLIHGILHLCGYDHERSEPEARRMARRERAVLRGIGPVPRLLVSGDSDPV
ncbi:MAG: rRNA maturation RNase YbeY [Nitrospira sp.]|nr:rRNA maturation RNase YbeY [Nitrospira sp.]